MRVFLCILLGLAMLRCGSETNVNRLIFVGDKDEESLDTQLEKARILYDKGDFSAAEKIALKAVARNRDNEKGGILLGYIQLGLAGFDVFSIASKLVRMNSTTTGTEAETAVVGEDECQKTTNKDAGEALSAFNCIFQISDTDLLALSVDAKVQDSDNPFFEDYPVLYPKAMPETAADSDPRDGVQTLAYIKKAIMSICPFVDPIVGDSEDVRVESDLRHQCSATIANRQNDVKAHFLWAIAHFLEAIAFNNILLYSASDEAATLAEDSSTTSSSMQSNLLSRVAALNKRTFVNEEIVDYIDAVDELATDINSIFDISEQSMLSAVLTDLQVTVRAFGKIDGIPQKIVQSISGALDKIQDAADELAEKAGGDSSDLSVKSQALRGKLNKSVAKNLGESIDKYAAVVCPSDEECAGDDQVKIAGLCDKFDSVSEGIPETDLKTMTPSSCQ